jgi:hypothetical protein
VALRLSTDRKPKYRSVIARLFIERESEFYSQRAERRHPARTEAHGPAKISVSEIIKGLTYVEKGYTTQSELLRYGEQDFRIEDGQFVATDDITTLFGSETPVSKATHRVKSGKAFWPLDPFAYPTPVPNVPPKAKT